MISFRNKKAEAERIRNYYAALQQFAKNNRDRIIAQQNEAAANEAAAKEASAKEAAAKAEAQRLAKEAADQWHSVRLDR